MRIADLLVFVLAGARRGHGPPPPEGASHDARTDWRWTCSHCWAFLGIGLLLWGIFIGIVVAMVTCEGEGC